MFSFCRCTVTASVVSSLTVALVSPVVSAGAQSEKIDTAMVARIRAEGLQRSQVMETLGWLTDVHGPRLTGSPGFEEAGMWAVKRLSTWNLTNVHKERWPFGMG